jgi:1,4-dihydroxy-6-naphthoate synthase
MSVVSATSPVFTLAHSPDPNDAFMFYAMAENKIDLRGYRFEHRLEGYSDAKRARSAW